VDIREIGAICLFLVGAVASTLLFVLWVRYRTLGQAFDGQLNRFKLLSARFDEQERQREQLATKLRETDSALVATRRLALNNFQREDDLTITQAALYAKKNCSTIRRWCTSGLHHRVVHPNQRIIVINCRDLEAYFKEKQRG